MAHVVDRLGAQTTDFDRPLEDAVVTDREFLERFDEIAARSGWRAYTSPPKLIDEWDQFVGECEAGYDWSIYEFENDRSIRDGLEKVFTDGSLQAFPQLEVLRERLDAVDDRFRRTCRDDVEISRSTDPWWRRCVPLRAEGRFADDLSRLFGKPPDGPAPA